jgi:hypothetical protein
VEVDSADRLNVRIVSKPIALPAAQPFNGPPPTRRSWFDYSDMSPGYKMLMYLWCAVAVGGIVAVTIQLIALR